MGRVQRQRDKGKWGWGGNRKKKLRKKIENERFKRGKRGKERAQTGTETYSVGVSGDGRVEGWINILPFTEWQAFSSLIYTLGRQKERSRAGPAILTLPLCSFYTTIPFFISPPALPPLAPCISNRFNTTPNPLSLSPPLCPFAAITNLSLPS